MTDFSVPQRMSRGAFFVLLWKNLKIVFSYSLIYFVIKVFNDGEGSAGDFVFHITYFILATMGLAVLMTSVAYFPKKFYVREGSLVFNHGLIQRETTTIPLEKIHTLRTKRGVAYQLFGMRGVTFDTLAMRAEEIELILDERDWQSLLSLIERKTDGNSSADAADEMSAQVKVEPPRPLIRFDNGDLALDALCQNHLKGAAILGGFLAVIYNAVSDLGDGVVEEMLDSATDYLDSLSMTVLQIVMLVVVVYGIVLVLWLAKVVLRYYDMTLSYDKELLTFNFGLLTRSTSRFSFNKVCTVWVKRNFFERKLGLCTLKMQQAFNATANKEEDNLKLYGRDRSEFFLEWWLGDRYASSPKLISSKSGRGMLAHSIALPFAVSLAVSIILCYFGLYVWVAVPAVYFLIMVVRGFCALRRSRITLTDSYVMVENGRFADIRNYVKYENIDVVRISKTPFTRWSHRVALSFSTSGTSFKVRSLPEGEAELIYELILVKAESVWRVGIESAECVKVAPESLATVRDEGQTVGGQL